MKLKKKLAKNRLSALVKSVHFTVLKIFFGRMRNIAVASKLIDPNRLTRYQLTISHSKLLMWYGSYRVVLFSFEHLPGWSEDKGVSFSGVLGDIEGSR